MNKIVKYLAFSLGSAVLVFGAVFTASAAEFIGPEGESGNVTVSADSEHKNLYTAGANVLINNKTIGDLYTAGGDVTVEGMVEQDLVAAGGNLYINGPVGGDLRIAGGNITINSTVGGDVLVLGGSVTLSEKATVGGDVIVNAGEVSISGPVAGKLTANGGVVSINSEVKGAVMIRADGQVKLGSKTIFGADAKYKSVSEAQVAEGAQVGGLQYEKISGREHSGAAKSFAGIISFGFIIKILAMIIVALIIYKLFPRKGNELVRHLEANPWANLGIGFLGFVVAPVIAILALVTLVGFYAAAIVFLLWLLWSLIAGILGTVFVGAWINKKLTKKTEIFVDWQGIAIGVVVLAIVGLVPVIGWLVVFLVFCAGFGTILRHVAGIIRNQQEHAIVIDNN